MTRHNRTSQAAEHRRLAAADAPDHADVRETPWYQFVEYLDQLLADPDLEWAAPTLRDIQDQVIDRQAVTTRQREAVSHLATARLLSWPFLTRPGAKRPGSL
jgi:hypothetical protein